MPGTVIDLFCGVGGMTHGFVKEGFAVAAGIDIDESCRYAYEKNNKGAKFILRDVSAVAPAEIEDLFSGVSTRVLVGCAPCQPFSLYTNRKSPDTKWELLRSFAKLVSATRPEVVSMENVPRLEQHDVFHEFVRSLERADYAVTHFLARGPEYGIPQRRTRLVLFASQFGPIELIPPTHAAGRIATVRDAIGHLPPIRAGEVCETDPLHRARGLTERNLRRLQATPEGGSWNDWSEELRLECHRKESGRTFRSVYGRMSWAEPGSVITTQCVGIGNGRFGHPEQDRAISLREAALLQTFPQTYDFIDPSTPKVSMLAIARQIGNAVPVRLGRVVARSIRRHLEVFLG